MRVLLSLVAIGLLLAGCSDDSKNPSGEAAPADACAVVTSEEVQKALGQPVGPATRSTQGVDPLPGTGCIYLATDESGDAVLISRSVSERSREVFDSSRKSVDPKTIVAVDGGGDGAEAYVSGESGLIQRGSTIVSVVVSRVDQPAATETAKKLLEAAADRL